MHVTCSPATGECQEYEDNGNQVCEVGDPGLITDTDGDGEFDCFDPDDDGDKLTDEFEDYYAQYYNQQLQDRDGDGIIDAADIVPGIASAAEMTIAANRYKSGSTCDQWTDADPFIPAGEFWVKMGSGAEIPLTRPEGWTGSNHIHDRDTDDVTDLLINAEDQSVVAGVMALPDDIFEWPILSLDEVPSVTISIGLKDHDHATGHERMDLNPAGGPVKAEIKISLTVDDPVPAPLSSAGSGDGDCNGRIGFAFVDTADSRPVQTAVAHRQEPSALLGL